MPKQTPDNSPALKGYLDFLENAIALQRSAIRFYLINAVAVFGLGLVAIAIAFSLGESYKWFLTIGGTFVSALSGLPIKQILDRRQRIAALAFLLGEFRIATHDPASVDQERFAFAEQRLRKYIDDTLGTKR